MAKRTKTGHSIAVQLWHFVIHLRWHYQVFILSGGFLLGGFLSDTMNWQSFLLQFANVHLLLFGGATAFNSFWDKDEGPIGGLRHPPEMERWMWFASLLVQALGLMIAVLMGMLFMMVYALSMLFFWLYSSPLARWKGKPVRSLFAIGLSTGVGSLLMGYLAAGNGSLSDNTIYAAAGVALIMLSLYPVSQIYQMEEDLERGDQTFAIQFGFRGIFRFFDAAFYSGLLLVSLALLQNHWRLALVFFATGLGVGLWVRSRLKRLNTEKDNYFEVMRIKFVTSLAFTCFLMTALLIKHTSVGMALGMAGLLE